ncbi:uncharacterized protein EURHEDRAFT_415984 [Aspergillus ruber CBS 135680]|uniref:Uncharacterized protein n=1 Tax=Aspergillus ruber (strain CBS 135680) TaxID=1388766 RepID=A0A017S5T2_ASPRC|nr:uncharacterized protein EURHEDRAFT_415984 [Aspergillus ruber CBS 135680]EYE91984.1 hypothetical protein EURHEDRAFT_415984 [Aspergillus ruber CBS 135680]
MVILISRSSEDGVAQSTRLKTIHSHHCHWTEHGPIGLDATDRTGEANGDAELEDWHSENTIDQFRTFPVQKMKKATNLEEPCRYLNQVSTIDAPSITITAILVVMFI